MRPDIQGTRAATSLVDVLDRVLDKGLVVAGDIRISLAEVELLTIRIRLLVCSLDKAREMGIDWWQHDRHLSPGRPMSSLEEGELREKIRLLEAKVAELTRGRGSGKRRIAAKQTRKPGAKNAR